MDLDKDLDKFSVFFDCHCGGQAQAPLNVKAECSQCGCNGRAEVRNGKLIGPFVCYNIDCFGFNQDCIGAKVTLRYSG